MWLTKWIAKSSLNSRYTGWAKNGGELSGWNISGGNRPVEMSGGLSGPGNYPVFSGGGDCPGYYRSRCTMTCSDYDLWDWLTHGQTGFTCCTKISQTSFGKRYESAAGSHCDSWPQRCVINKHVKRWLVNPVHLVNGQPSDQVSLWLLSSTPVIVILMLILPSHGFLQCFDTVGLVIWPVKIVPDMTCNVLTLNLAQSTNLPSHRI